jgi:hypothetical protein
LISIVPGNSTMVCDFLRILLSVSLFSALAVVAHAQTLAERLRTSGCTSR